MWIIDKDNNAFFGEGDLVNFSGKVLFVTNDRIRGYYGELHKGKPDGKGIVFCGSGLCCDGNFVDGKLSGETKLYKYAFSIPYQERISLSALEDLFKFSHEDRFSALRELLESDANELVYDGIITNNIPENMFSNTELHSKFKKWQDKELIFQWSNIEGTIEGYSSMVTHLKYERSPKNRKIAIALHGYVCQACGFNFSTAYGKLGQDYIEVHHNRNVSMGPANYDLVNDLITLCSNCHSMIHRIDAEDALSILKKYL